MLKINSKTIAGLFVAFVLTFAVTASATWMATSETKISKTSSSANVMWLQSTLNAVAKSGLTEDGKYGKMTTAAIKAFQVSKGLSADGIAGKMTLAALNAAGATLTAAPGGPVVVVSGALCPNGMTLASNCSAAPTTPVVTTSGSAGDVTVTSTSTDVETTVNEGASTKIKGFKIEASGSDVAVTNVKVSLTNTNAPTTSYYPSNYMSEVAVWMGSTKVGSAMVSDFTKSGYVYSKSIALSNAVVKMGVNSKATFYVTVTANSSIDSTDMATDTWAMKVDNIRFQDGTGVVMTASDTVGDLTTTAFSFQSQATSGDVKVVVSKASTSPIAQNLTVSTTASTKNVPLLDFKVKTTGSTASFDSLVISTTLTTAGAAGAGIIGELQLVDGSGAVIATLDGTSFATGTSNKTFTLDDTKVIAKDTTETFHVTATVLKGITANFVSGASFTASFGSFAPEDSNHDIVTDTGSATGAAQAFVYSVPTIALTSTPTLALFAHTDGTTAGLEDSYVATISFNVTAPENAAVYVPLDSFAYGTNGTAGVLFTKTGGATVTSASVSYAGTDNLTSITDTNSYRVDAGVTQKFTLSVYLTGNDANGKIAMTGLWYETSAGTPDGSPLVSGLSSLYTPLVYLAK